MAGSTLTDVLDHADDICASIGCDGCDILQCIWWDWEVAQTQLRYLYRERLVGRAFEVDNDLFWCVKVCCVARLKAYL